MIRIKIDNWNKMRNNWRRWEVKNVYKHSILKHIKDRYRIKSKNINNNNKEKVNRLIIDNNNRINNKYRWNVRNNNSNKDRLNVNNNNKNRYKVNIIKVRIIVKRWVNAKMYRNMNNRL